MSEIVSYGWGSAVGEVCHVRSLADLPAEQGDDVVWVVPSVTSLAGKRLPRSVCAVLTRERVSVYSHEATAVWQLGVPVLTGVDDTRWPDGIRVMVDFDRGQVQQAANGRAWTSTRRASQSLEVLCEVENQTDLSRVPSADGVGIIDVEDLVRMGQNDARRLCEDLAEVCRAPLVIRFFDQHPSPRIRATMGYRGARVARDRRVVSRFLRCVDDLELRQEPVVVLPMYAHADEFAAFARQMAPLTSSFGVAVECPEAALCLGMIVDRCVLVEVGLNDLSQYTLAWSREVVDCRIMSPHKLSDGVSALVREVSAAVIERAVQYSLGLDLRPSAALVDQIASLGVPAISCPAVLAARWKALMPGHHPPPVMDQ